MRSWCAPVRTPAGPLHRPADRARTWRRRRSGGRRRTNRLPRSPSAVDDHRLALAPFFAQGRARARAGRADEVSESPHGRALAVARLEQILETADGAQPREGLAAGARVVARCLRLRPEVAGAQRARLVGQRALQEDDRRDDLVDLPLAAFRPLLDRVSGDVAGGEVVRGLDQPGSRGDQGGGKSRVAQHRPELETQRLEPAQQLPLVLLRHEEADLQRQLLSFGWRELAVRLRGLEETRDVLLGESE